MEINQTWKLVEDMAKDYGVEKLIVPPMRFNKKDGTPDKRTMLYRYTEQINKAVGDPKYGE